MSRKVVSENPSDMASPSKRPKLDRPYFNRDTLNTKNYNDGDYLKVISFNVAGLRSFINNHGNIFADFISTQSPDFLCLQETKLQDDHVHDNDQYFKNLGYTGFWTCSQEKKGYSGTAILIKNNRVSIPTDLSEKMSETMSNNKANSPKAKKTLKQTKLSFTKVATDPDTTTTTTTTSATATTTVPSSSNSCSSSDTLITTSSSNINMVQNPLIHIQNITYDVTHSNIMKEGRMITLELDSFYLINCYVPNSGEGLKRLDYRLNIWDPYLRSYLIHLQSKKPVIFLGDLNVAHLDLDIYNHDAKHIIKQAGLTPQERASFGQLLSEAKLVDVLRHFHPETKGQFTYWSKRTSAYDSNSGLRLDYFLCTPSLLMGENNTEGNTGDDDSMTLSKKVKGKVSKDTDSSTSSSNSSSSSSSTNTKHSPSIYDYMTMHDHPIAKLSDHCPIGVMIKL